MLLKGGSLGDRGPPSSGPGRGTLRACASLQLGAEALTAPVLPCHREPSWGWVPFFQGPGLLLSPYLWLCWYGPLPVTVSAPLLGTRLGFPPRSQPCLAMALCFLPLPIAESGSAGRRGGPAGPKQCWGGDTALSHSQCLPVAAWGSRDQNLPWDSRVRYTAPP